MKSKEFLNALKGLLSGWIIVFHFIIFGLFHSGYLFLLTKNFYLSVFIGVLASLLSLRFISYPNAKAKKYKRNLEDLNKYATTITFNLQSGRNVLTSLQETSKFVSPELRITLSKVINELKETGKLNTDHFKKYDFKPINIFNSHLKVKDEKGGDTKTIFFKANKNINNAIAKHDELYRKKHAVAVKTYVMGLMAISMPLVFSLVTKELYNTFLESMFSLPIILIFYGYLVQNLFKTELNKTNTSMYV